MPVLTRPGTLLVRARSVEPGMRITRDIHVGGGVYKPAEPLTITAVHLFRDRARDCVLLMVFAGSDLWPLPWVLRLPAGRAGRDRRRARAGDPMNRRRTGWRFLLAAALLLLLALPVGGWLTVTLAAIATACTAVAFRLFTVGGGR
ncbi:hypothetical protein ACN27G_27490 [Plantactinospora sp. WMMB334]|uniref:hypothetical protein n=1 Tax=Plantactinospora sp. WMMB334 TaxID=3404119 RepID=UPI003B9365A8